MVDKGVTAIAFQRQCLVTCLNWANRFWSKQYGVPFVVKIQFNHIRNLLYPKPFL